MKPTHPADIDRLADRQAAQFGARLAARLDEAPLPHDISERLRVARLHALAARPRAAVAQISPAMQAQGGPALTLGSGFWAWLPAPLTLALLLAGLWALQPQDTGVRGLRLAQVEPALVIDELPPSAYADPGFLHYLRLTHDGAASAGEQRAALPEGGA